MSRILVTGGCGYIGSNVINKLIDSGYHVTIIDNLSTGSKDSIPESNVEFVFCDLSNISDLRRLFEARSFSTVFHLAASIVVPESIEYPLNYYQNNTSNTVNLLKVCQEFQVQNFIFSSTAAVYGDCQLQYISEDVPTSPQNPYASSKAMAESILKDTAKVCDMNFIIFRYFNVAGTDMEGRYGQRYSKSHHLIKTACATALGARDSIQIYGNNYDTFDGTCIRDFIHVEDLAMLHLLGLRYLESGGPSQIFNCGYGKGFSVKNVIDVTKKISGVNFKVEVAPRRKGDIQVVVANNEKIKKAFGWVPLYDDLELMIESALNWEKKMHLGIQRTKYMPPSLTI